MGITTPTIFLKSMPYIPNTSVQLSYSTPVIIRMYRKYNPIIINTLRGLLWFVVVIRWMNLLISLGVTSLALDQYIYAVVTTKWHKSKEYD